MFTHVLAYFKKDNSVLLGLKKRGFGKGKWNGYGGKISKGESLVEGLVRECQEECGLEPKTFERFGRHTFVYPDKIMEVAVFQIQSWTGDLIETDEMKPEWFSINSLPFDDMWPDDRHWLLPLLGGRQVTYQAEFNKDFAITNYNIDIN